MFGQSEPESSDGFGHNRFLEKQNALEEDKQNSMDVEKALQLSRELGTELSRELKNAAVVFADSIVPGFIKRMMNQRVYHNMAVDVDEKQNKAHEDVVATIKQHKLHFKAEAKKRNLLKARNRAHSILETETKKELGGAKVMKEAAIVADYMERRTKQLEEVQSAIDAHVQEMKAKMESELVQRRAFNLSHWSEQGAILHDEALSVSKQRMLHMRQKFNEPFDIARTDWADRTLSRAKLQVFDQGNPPSTFSNFGGIFSVNNSPDSRAASDVHLFNSLDTFQSFERASHELLDAQGQTASMQVLYDALNLESNQQDEGKSAI